MCIGGGGGAGDAGGGAAATSMQFNDYQGRTYAQSPGALDAGGGDGSLWEQPKPVEAAPAAAPAAAAPAAAPITPAVNAPSVDPGVSGIGRETGSGTEPAGLARFGERYYRSKMRNVASFGSVGGYSGKGSTLGTT